jgi:hypothetical protein
VPVVLAEKSTDIADQGKHVRSSGAAHPDLTPQQRADLLIRDPRVGQHRQNQIQQRLPGLAAYLAS